MRQEAGQQLEAYLSPLVAYCDQHRQHPEQFSQVEFRHGYELRQAIDALLRYDEATEALLAECRALLDEAQALAQSRVPSLNVVVLAQAVHYERRLRERLMCLCAEHGIFPPAQHPPDSVVHRTQAHLDSSSMQAYAALPLETRRTLNTLSPADWHHLITHGPESRQAQAQAH